MVELCAALYRGSLCVLSNITTVLASRQRRPYAFGMRLLVNRGCLPRSCHSVAGLAPSSAASVPLAHHLPRGAVFSRCLTHLRRKISPEGAISICIY